MKYLFLGVLTALCTTFAAAQTDPVVQSYLPYVTRFSQVQYGGTARLLGVGGAFTALGADFGAVSQNPAGLAMFRSNELVFSPGVRFTSTDTALPNQVSDNDQASKFGFQNLGFVFNTTPSGNSKWSTFNVALGFNQTASYRQNIYYQGTSGGTILNPWFNDSEAFLNGGGNPDDLDPFGAGLGYQANAIYFQDGVASYDFASDPSAPVQRAHSIITSGSTSEMTFGFAGNYDEKLMIGATFGVPIVSYRQDANYTETDPGGGLDGNVPYFSSLDYNDRLRTNGVGFNAKFGATYRVSQQFRIGAAVHSPTFLALTDNYSSSLDYAYEDGNGNSSSQATSPDGTFDYKLRTPWRANFGGAVLLKKYGFVSGDVEWVDYSAARFNLTSDVSSTGNQQLERDLNNGIQRNFKPTVNYRVGGELVLDVFRLRAGYSLNGKAADGEDGFNTAWSAGVGVRGKSAYLDLGYRRATVDGSVQSYAASDAPEAKTKAKFSNILVTVGVKF